MAVVSAGYNNLEVAEFLLERGADVNAQDKGGLIPLHNASSYGHLDIAALLIKYNTAVNATDKWGFTPLHEAAQKGRTQLSALLVWYSFFTLGFDLLYNADDSILAMMLQLAHGADPFLKNQEGQTPLDLASADDVRSLLQDAMASHPSAPVAQIPPVVVQQSEMVVMPSGASVALPVPSFRGDGCSAPACANVEGTPPSSPAVANIPAFLNRSVFARLERNHANR